MAIKENFLKKIGLLLAAIIVLYTLIGFFLLPIIAKNIVEDRLSKALNREVTIKKIAINPYALTATIDVLAVKEKNKDIFFSVQKMVANLSLSSLFTLSFIASDLSLDGLYVNITRNEDASFNFSDLLNSAKEDERSSADMDDSDKEPLGFILKIVNITQGEIDFTDNAAKVSHHIKDFSLSLPFLSTKRKSRHKKAKLDINFVLNQAKFDIHIESTPFAEDLAMEADIKTTDIDVIHYLSYLPVPENILLKSLDLNLNLHLGYQKKNANNSLVVQGKLTALNADISGLDEEIIKFPAVTLEIANSDILANQLNISKILMQTPELNLNRDKNGKLNLLKYIPQNKENIEEIKKGADHNKKPFDLNLADFEIKDAAIFFQDFSNEKLFKSKLSPLNIRIENLKLGESVSGEYSLKLETEAKEIIDSNGRFQTHPVGVDGALHLSDIVFNKYAPYYESLVGFDMKDGRMNLSAGFEISQEQDKFDIKIKNQEFLIQSLSIFDQQSKEEMINIPEFKIKGSFIDIGNKKIDIGKVFVQNGKILLKRLKDDQINLLKTVLPVRDPVNSKPIKIETDPKPVEVKASPWAVTLKSFSTTGLNVVFNDLTNKEPVWVDLSDISIKVEDFKNFSKEKGRVAAKMNWNEDGRISIKGNVVPSILNAVLDIDLEKIDIKSLQPYFEDSIRILVTDGSINAKGNFKLDLGDTPKVQFDGQSSVTNFISLDKKTAKDFFKCNSLYLSGLDVSVFPVNVKVKDISLTDFYSRLIISDTGEMNLNTVFKKETPKDQGIAPEKEQEIKQQKNQPLETPQISVESVTLQGGNISFSDYLTRPNFTATMKQIAGSVTGLSSDEQSRAKLNLQGLHGQSSPLDIVGTINPLAKKKFADIDISYKDIDLTNFTPYSSKYLGYKIEKGKLILDLEYRVDGNKLNSENRVRFDNFELGERVDSEHATSLPVGLAISLLKNSDGRIDLDLPVTGELDDPEFKIGSIIFKMITNLILKVVTSPFAVIGSMFGGSEDLGFVEFEYGQADIGDSNYEKIDTLADILQKKPSVNLEIKGGYDKLRDAEGLRIKGFEDLIKATKLKEMISLGSAKATLEDVVIEKEEMELYIPTVYAHAQFPKPMDAAGKQKELDVEEKKKLLVTNINIGEDDLRLLAMNRSKMVKAYLLSTGKVEKERVFLIEPSENDGSDTERNSKVKFTLK